MAEASEKAHWAMIIDLDRCTGCQACVSACSLENNVPFTGEKEVAYGRGLHWIRVQRYWHGEYPNISPERYPTMCQQCGHAPCEPVCPVFATLHSEEVGINLQVYNRCIGTRYCANNCPYMARNYNWFDYTLPSTMNNYLNPNVTVRGRGVMEKCTFCIQRIQTAERQALAEGRQVADEEVVPACAQACPTNAITFGNLNDQNSDAYKLSLQKRGYKLLEELGTEPRITYLKGGGGYGG
jgi:Fe-S-cluster-containing dehydrogenase component